MASWFLIILAIFLVKTIHSEETKFDRLINHPACRKDLLALAKGCGLTETEMENDFATLTCAQNLPPDQFEAITETCEQVLWRFKLNLTTSPIFLHQIENACARDADKMHNCRNQFPGNENAGNFMSCLMTEKLQGSFKPACNDFLTQIEAVIFSDYNLIGDFANKCANDIEVKFCGHVRRQMHSDSKVIFYHHSQGLVLECLSKHVDQVEPACKEEILKIAEFQSDDFHLDRPLYFACKDDRQQLCSNVQAGQGRVFECLLNHKADEMMSESCREQLRRRQKLISENYKVSRGLSKACKEDIANHKCKKRGAKNNENKTVRLAEILLCLEEVLRNEDGQLDGHCQAEMKAHRQMLMEDYSISPELVAQCGKAINDKCHDKETQGHPGEIIHCLMKNAMEHSLDDKECEDELQLLLKEADVSSDWQVDPVLKNACQEVVNVACDPKLESSYVLSCLMNQYVGQSRHMTSKCKQRLMEIQYFMARDFSLDPRLYQACRNEARDICQAEDNWFTLQTKSHQLVFACLTRNLYDGDEEPDDNLSDECADQVERVLEERAISVNLHPEIEDSCRGELTQFCIGATAIGQEFQCLQDNFDNLEAECLNALKTYTQMEAKNAVLNPVIASACHAYIDRNCQEEVSRKDEGLVIQCLIKIKEENINAMDDKCSSAVEHWQILSLKDWHFSYKFKQACKIDVQNYCQLSGQSKADVVSCLSQIARNDVLLAESQPPKLSSACRGQLKFELLQKHTSIHLNPRLAAHCKKAIRLFCPMGQGNVLECLKNLEHEKMSNQCRSVVFEEEQEEVLINGVDHQLLLGCKHEIKSHCPEQNEVNALLNCLREAKKDANFDRGCKMIVNRRIIQHTKDYRLRPRLQRACERDLKKFCSQVLLQASQEGKDNTKDFLEGQIIQCLQRTFVEDADLLTPPCRHEMEVTVRDEAMDYRANPIILLECPKTIKKCQETLMNDHMDNRTSYYGSRIEECLRDMFKGGDISDGESCSKALANLIEATNIDIKSDPLLHKACAVDISKFCRDIPHGSGQQLKCLSNVIRDAQLGLEPKCDLMLRSRLEMFDKALKIVPINGIQDLWIHVSNSPQKNYLLLLIFVVFSAIFIFGLCCGRVTRRLRRDLKDR